MNGPGPAAAPPPGPARPAGRPARPAGSPAEPAGSPAEPAGRPAEPAGRPPLPGWFTLLRRQLHLTPEVNAVLAVLVAVTTLFVVAAPRAAAAAYDDALVHRVATAPPVQRDLTVSGPPGRFFEPLPFTAALVTDVRQTVLDRLGTPASGLLGATTFAAYSQGFDTRTLPDGGQPAGEPARLTLRLQQGWAERAELVAGRAPTARLDGVAVDPDLTSPDPDGDLPALEVALAEPVAATLDVRPGDALLLDAPGDALPLPQFTVVVTGIFRPVDGTDDYWAADPLILAPARAPTGDGGLRRLATALVAEDGYGALTGAFAGAGAPPPSSRPEVSGALTHAWRFVWDADRLQAADAAVLTAAVGRVQTAGTALAPFPVRVSTGLADLLDTHARAVAVTRSLDSVAYAGIAALAVLSMSLTVLVGTSQRRDRLRLVRARGASLTQVSLLLAAQTLAWVVPGAVVALVVAWVLVPDGGSPVPLLLAAATVVLPLLVVPWAVRAETRALHGPPARGRLHPAARLAPELAVLALTVLGVLALRRRGLAQAGQGGVDPYAALVPTLVALAVGLVVLRLYPYPIRWAASALARGSGLTAFLGTARAARARPASALPLLVLLLAVALSVFAGTVLSTVTGEQSRAAWRAVGADLRVDDPALTAEQVAALEAAAGVTAVVPAYRDAAGSVGPLRPVTVLGADPAAFASLLAGTPLTVDLPDLGGGGGRDDPLPAAVSTAVRADAALGTAGRLIRLDPRAAVPALQRGATAGEVLVLVPLADLAAVTGGGVEPTAVLVDLDGALGGGAGGDGRAGDPGADGNAESRVEALLGPSASRDVTSREEVRAAVADAPLPAHLRRAYGGTVVLAAGYSVVSVALLLALGAAERRAAISRLRTMGMRARDVRRLPAWEVLPLTVAALLPGVAVGLALPALLGPALDLAPFTGGPAEPPLRPDPLVTVALCLLVAGAAAIAVVLDAARGRRANLSSALRIGDQS